MTGVDSKQIVICDDEYDIREMLGAVVRSGGYQPLLAENLADVMYHIGHDAPALLLLDIRMPEQDGFEIAESLRRHKIDIPIIFITAHDNLFCRMYSPAVGAVGYMVKPIEPKLLLERIDAALSNPSGLLSR
ncbi:MAG TPA: response regulator [Planctomycetota bacterium]|nr:response regulator [Planctomycetota bacterium]